ncbi:DUF1152 domain-containing protein [Halobacterium sp. KA-6]|uniref:DUF1152 domain-containing protein n=1 Tax=Halobacterium sp. KA-6 TaxID=2896368 RepID=UPI001E39E057|nr:DUF1152 domain-containing protein [Halobacterium sp. KA-6]MCD2205264.1 DUF1152 domain-containing protein [Halobacterium sp. KA-6]
MDTIEEVYDCTRALIFGIGGGGDVVGTIPTMRFLEEHDVDTIIGGLTWERSVADPQPGPRSLDELTEINRVSEAVGLGSGDTQTNDGVQFAESTVASTLQRDVAFLDITGGMEGFRSGLETACEKLDIDLIVGIDSGGDVLATGTEPGIVSPLADGICLAALSEIQVPTCIGMFGYGSDGELTVSELDRNIGAIAADSGLLGAWGLTPDVGAELERIIERVPTDASRLPLRVSQGEVGTHPIRGGKRTVELTPASTITFYLDTTAVANRSSLARIVSGTNSVESADEQLRAEGYDTELQFERSEIDTS